MEVKEILLESIVVSELNTRKDLEAGTEDSSLDDLAFSIAEKGLLSPIVVIQKEDKYELIVGQRRFLACKKLGWKTIPSIVRTDLDDNSAVALSLIENVHRADMNPMDKARALKKLYERFQTYTKVSEETGLSPSTVSRYVSLLDLPEEIQQSVSTRNGSAGIGTLSTLARTFERNEDMISAFKQISGFTQSVQREILRHSEGDIDALPNLVKTAQEGTFDVRFCRGIDTCPEIPERLRSEVERMIEAFNKGELN